MFIFLKHLNLYVMIKMILILELTFSCEAYYCIIANNVAESYENPGHSNLAGQTLAMILFLLLPVILRRNLLNLNLDAKP